MEFQELGKHSCGQTHTHTLSELASDCCDQWRPAPSLQLAVDVQVPHCFGGLGGQVLYVDTEGSFQLQRLVDLAAAAVTHCSLLAEDEEQRIAVETFTVETVLSNVFVVRTPARLGRGRHRSDGHLISAFSPGALS